MKAKYIAFKERSAFFQGVALAALEVLDQGQELLDDDSTEGLADNAKSYTNIVEHFKSVLGAVCETDAGYVAKNSDGDDMSAETIRDYM